MPDLIPIRRALISVSDKRDLVPFARGLRELGVQIISTGGTAAALSEAGLDVLAIEQCDDSVAIEGNPITPEADEETPITSLGLAIRPNPFTLAAGIAVLFAAVQSTIDERRFESAMLRALGARRSTVLSGVMAEFAALGIAAGVLASAGASVLAAVVAARLFDLPYEFNPLLWVAGLGAGVVVVCTSGFLAARGAINAAPVDVLRAAG